MSSAALKHEDQCVILVGGRGTRLGALTEAKPKPLLPVAGRPFLDYLVFEAHRHGFRRFLLLAGYRGDALTSAAEAMTRKYPDASIDVVIEPEPLGTGGAVRYAAGHLADEFLLLNGDSLFDINLLDLATRPVEGLWTAKIALKPGQDPARYGTVITDGERVVQFREKSPSVERVTINGGVYWLKKSVVSGISPGPTSLERDIFPKLAEAGLMRGYVYDRFLLDIGIPESLAAAETLVPGQTRRGAVFFDRDGVLNEDHGYVHRREEFQWKPEAIQSVKRANDTGRFAFVVTNQAGVARGYYSESDVMALHAWMNADLRGYGAHIDAFAYCPHHPDAVIEKYRAICKCRKPQPGMINALMAEWSVESAKSILLGDRDTDIAAATAAGVSGHLVGASGVADAMRTAGA